MRRILLPASLFALLAAPACAALVNGSFEPAGGAPTQGSGHAAAIPGWRVTGPGVTWLAVSGDGLAAPNGERVVRLTGDRGNTTRVEQLFATTPGQRYDVAFWLGSRADDTGRGQASLRVDVAGTARTVAIDNPGAELLWQAHVLAFTATAATTTLAFHPGRHGAAWLDGVAVRPAAAGAGAARESR